MRPLVYFAVLTGPFWAMSNAHPHHHEERSSPNPAAILKRALPQFRDFSNDDPHVGQIQQAYKDMATMVNYIFDQVQSQYPRAQRVFLKYFDASRNQLVADVLRATVDPANTDASTGADVLSKITMRADNFWDQGCTLGRAAYTSYGKPDTNIHLCNEDGIDAFAYPALSAVSCGALDPFVSSKMMTLGGTVLLHELIHTPEVSQSILQNVVNRGDDWTGDYAYGPEQVLQLQQGLMNNFYTSEKVSPLPTSLENADSYAWYATELYWSLKCNHDYDLPQTNDYTVTGVESAHDALGAAVMQMVIGN